MPEPESLVVMKWRAEGVHVGRFQRHVVLDRRVTLAIPTKGRIGTQFPYPALELFQRNTDVLSSAFCYFVVERLSVTIDDETEAVKGAVRVGRLLPRDGRAGRRRDV